MLVVQVMSASAVLISLVYQDPSDPFFTLEAQQTLDKADVSYTITTTLAALSQDVYTGTNGSTTATANWHLRYRDPTDGTTIVTLDTFDLAESEFRIFVGSRFLPGSVVGSGGPGGAGLSSLGGTGVSSEWVGAVANMEATSNASMPRDGPEFDSISGSITGGTATAFYDMAYGYN